MSQTQEIQSILHNIQRQYAPDKRTEIFEVEVVRENNNFVLKGKTTSINAEKTLKEKFKNISVPLKIDVELLPSKSLGEKNWGIVYTSVATMRSAPRFSSEMVTQALLGMPLRILEKDGDWYRVQTSDKYIGWMKGSVALFDRNGLNKYLTSPRIIINSMASQSYDKADENSQPVSDIVLGNMFEVLNSSDNFYYVKYSDGRNAYIKKNDALLLNEWHKKISKNGNDIVKTAYRFLGLPYTWGGTSSKGVDCSGFTKSVYLIHGIILERDASQQVKYGKLIDDKGDFSNAQPGDLVFFGEKPTDENPKERIIHVGIYIGNQRFIHSLDYVKIGSFNPKDALYDAYNTGRYLRTKRVLGEKNGALNYDIFENDFYKK